ncbi:hypothetical protein AAHU49_06895 [Klebsiella quasipneumoniae subsp. quasipneumoniae]|uniref:hypothetical protein n=1 Tax=Klebsiella quasipneumoniae TaxID=1463165 RepID=UPI0011592B3B|nr:hypothetical protein [Klebsiella quasipneumoniae]
MRGKVIKVTFLIEYPDGSQKEASFNDASEIQAIYLSEDVMDDKMKNVFNRSTNWHDNPTMLIQKENEIPPRCHIDYCRIP